jgi:hypothetical protein
VAGVVAEGVADDREVGETPLSDRGDEMDRKAVDDPESGDADGAAGLDVADGVRE